MKLFQLEFKKIFLFSKNWVVLVIVIFSQILLLNINTPHYNFETRQYNERYQNYLSIFGGKINETKQHNIIKEQERIEELEKESWKLFSKLYNGEYTPEEYDSKLTSYNNLYEEKMAFQQIQNQYDYAAEDPENRYVMDENGWYVLLQENDINFLLIFCVIYIVTQIFCPDYETGMYNILSCSKNGKKLVLIKLIICILFITMFFLATLIIQMISAQIKFGLYNIEYPLQSISYFNACPYDLTIAQGFIIIYILKFLSLSIIGIITAAISVMTKKSMSSFFVSIIVTLLPYFLFDIKEILYYIPHLGFMLSGYYLRGFEDVSSDEMMSATVSIPFEIIVCECFFCILLLIIFVCFTIYLGRCRPLRRSTKK